MDIDLRYDAIENLSERGMLKKISFPMIRCRNIIGRKKFGEVEEKFLVEEYEKKLFSSVKMKEICNRRPYTQKRLYFSSC